MNFNKLRDDILMCRECEEKFGFVPNPVVRGNGNVKIFQISQAPSKNVHITGKPFTDASGKKLVEEWYKIDYDTFYNKDIFYLTSLAHCYPGKNKSGGDRLPPIICAKKWLLKEMNLVNKQLYIIIGSRAAKFFFPNEDFTSLVFSNKEINGISTIILPHPSPLNIKWYKDNPKFYESRLDEIRKKVHKVLEN